MNPHNFFARLRKSFLQSIFLLTSFAIFSSHLAYAAVTTLTPGSYTTLSGSSGGQPVATSIAIQDLTGSKDSWNKYVEFGPNGSQKYDGYQSFSLPASVTPASITSIQVKVNYRGPNISTQIWTWKIYNWVTNSYITIGTNAAAPGWGNWTVIQFNVSGQLANYVRADGLIQIGLSANNTADSADIDYEGITVTSGGVNSSAPSSSSSKVSSSSKSSIKSSVVSSVKSSSSISSLRSSSTPSSKPPVSSSSSSAPSNGPKIGVISYWGTDTSLYNLLPENSTALINPDSGIFSGQSQTIVTNVNEFSNIVASASSRHVSMLAYIPTGYFSHTCNVAGQCQTWTRIEAQVQAYFQYMPQLAGVFFDEAAPAQWDCNAFIAEYKKLRDIVRKYNSQAKIAYNAGVPDNCVVNGAIEGEIVVMFESDQASFVAQANNVKASTTTALNKGVIPWNLVYSVKTIDDLNNVFNVAKSNGTALFYATDIGGNWQAGENTWGSLPPYWTQEVNLMK